MLALVLGRPDKRNALDTATIESLLGALDGARADTDIRALVVSGSGPSFCAGIDLGEFSGSSGEAMAGGQRRTELLAELLLRAAEFPKPLVAAVHGAAVGAGAALALACDVLVMGAGARIAYPEARKNMVGSIVMANLVHRLGYRWAFELMTFGEALSSDKALALGLANRVVSDDRVGAEALAIASSLAQIEPHVLSETKRLLRQADDLTLARALALGVESTKRERGL